VHVKLPKIMHKGCCPRNRLHFMVIWQKVPDTKERKEERRELRN